MPEELFVFKKLPKETKDLDVALDEMPDSFKQTLLESYGALEAAIISQQRDSNMKDLRAELARYLSHPKMGVIRWLKKSSDIQNLNYHNDRLPDPHTMGFVLPEFIRIATGEVLKGNYQKPQNAFFGVMAAAMHDAAFGINDGNKKNVQFYDKNEPLGAGLAQIYMLTFGFNNDEINSVTKPIEYTWVRKDLKGDNKKGLITDDDYTNAMVLRDADLSYLASSQITFFRVEGALMAEIYARRTSDLYDFLRTTREKLIKAYRMNGAGDETQDLQQSKEHRDFYEALIGDHGTKQHMACFTLCWDINSYNFMRNFHHWNTATAKENFDEPSQRNLNAYFHKLLAYQKSFEISHGLKHVELADVFPGYFPK